MWRSAIRASLVTWAIVATSASASALPLPTVTINGAAPSAGGPQVNLGLESDGSDGGGGDLYILTVSFPANNDTGDEVTAVSGAFNTKESPRGIVSVEEEVGDSNPGGMFQFFANDNQCFPVSDVRQSFSCPNFFGGFGPGVQQSYVIDTTQGAGDPTPPSQIDVTVKMCGQTSGDAVIASRCDPPGRTRITQAKIDQHARTAAFHYQASHALHYECELVYDKEIRFRAPCAAHKRYAHGLAQGKYAFIVWGVNAGGAAPRSRPTRSRSDSGPAATSTAPTARSTPSRSPRPRPSAGGSSRARRVTGGDEGVRQCLECLLLSDRPGRGPGGRPRPRRHPQRVAGPAAICPTPTPTWPSSSTRSPCARASASSPPAAVPDRLT